MNKIIEFKKVLVTKALWEDTECSECSHSFGYKQGESEYVYTYGGERHSGLQLCQTCFDKLKSPEGGITYNEVNLDDLANQLKMPKSAFIADRDKINWLCSHGIGHTIDKSGFVHGCCRCCKELKGGVKK